MTALLAARVLVLALAAVACVATLSTAVAQPGRMDFVAQYAGARLVATGRGELVVDQQAVLAAEREAAPERTALLPFVQPPAMAVVLSPLGLLAFGTAFLVMAGLDAALLVVAIALLVRPRAGPLDVWTLLLAPPAAVAVAHAQTSPLVLLLVALAQRAGPFASGLALGLTVLRPQTAPLLLIAALGDRRRTAGAAVGVAVVVLASVAVVGLGGMQRYVSQLVDAAGWSVSGEHGLGTAFGWSGLAAALGAAPVGMALAIACLVIGATIVLRSPPASRVPIAAGWSLLAGPHVLLHDAVLAFPALLAARRESPGWIGSLVIASLVHLLVAPIGVLWSLALGVRQGLRRS